METNCWLIERSRSAIRELNRTMVTPRRYAQPHALEAIPSNTICFVTSKHSVEALRAMLKDLRRTIRDAIKMARNGRFCAVCRNNLRELLQRIWISKTVQSQPAVAVQDFRTDSSS